MVNQNQQVVLTAAGLIAIAVLIGAVIIYSYVVTVSGSGTIINVTPGLQVFGDSAASKEIKGISWGTINVGQSAQVTMWIKNNGTIPLKLSMAANNWDPQNAPQYLSLTWSYNNVAVQPGAVVAVDFTLSVSPSTTGITTFSAQITISGVSGG